MNNKLYKKHTLEKSKKNQTQMKLTGRFYDYMTLTRGFLLGSIIGLVSRVFANGPGDPGSISGYVILKTLKMVLDTSLLNTQQYKVRVKGEVEQSREGSSALPYTSV